MTLTASCLAAEFKPRTFQFRMCAGSIMILRNKSDLEEQSDNTLYQVSSRNCLRECPSEKNSQGLSVRSWHRLLKTLHIFIQCLLANLCPFIVYIQVQSTHDLFLQVRGAFLRCRRGEARKSTTPSGLLARWLQLLLPSFIDMGNWHDTP